MSSLPKMLQKLFLLCCLYSFVENVEIVKQIHVLFRHGERSPTSSYPTDPHRDRKWEGGPGYLTNRGKMQMYIFGQNLKNYYNTFLPRYYLPKEVNISSSSSERCLMSAELTGAGLFPPKDAQIWNSDLLWQPIPIHYLPRNLDNLIIMRANCTEYDKEFVEVHNSSKVRQYNKEYQNLYEYLTHHTGSNIDNIEDVELLYNTLEIYKMNNLSLPYWINDTLMAEMKIIAAQNLAIYSETEYMKKMKGGFFLKTVLDLMIASSKKSKDIPMINMYSGHDLTIVHVMRALNLIDDTFRPRFGSSLILELYEDSTIKVQFMDHWNGEPKEQVLENCGSPCTINKFQLGYIAVLPTNWAEECKSAKVKN